MSRFLDRLERISLGAPAPMGFGAVRGDKTPGMALVAFVSGNYSGGIDVVSNLVPDAALFAGNAGLPALEEVGSSVGEKVPWGVRVDSWSEEGAKNYVDGGFDLLAFEMEGTPLSVVAPDHMTRVLCVGADLQPEKMREVGALPVDAILLSMTGHAGPITLVELAAIAGASRRTDKYVLVEVSQIPAPKDLEVLRNTGVHGLVVDVGTVSSSALGELKGALLDMPKPPRPRRERAAALVPGSVFFPGTAPEQEEEGPEEDE